MKSCNECNTGIPASRAAFKILRNGREELLCISCLRKVVLHSDQPIDIKSGDHEIYVDGGSNLSEAMIKFLESEEGRKLIKSIAI